MILHVIASPRPIKQSRSQYIAQAFFDEYRSSRPNDKIIEVHLFDQKMPMSDALDANTRIHQFFGKELTGEEKERFEWFMSFINPLFQADGLVITTPMWNFSIPWALKRWLDTVIQARITFRYGPEGAIGLLKSRGIIIASRGGEYPENGQSAQYDFQIPYLKTVMGFIGIHPLETVIAEGLDMISQDEISQRLEKARDKARLLARDFF